MGYPTASPAYRAIVEADIVTLPAFMSMPTEIFDQLEYHTPSEDDATKMVIKPLTLGIKQCMRLFIQYAKALIRDPDSQLITDADWMALTENGFNSYRIDPSIVLPGGAVPHIRNTRNPSTRCCGNLQARYQA